ncbi:hypothetical protein L3X38_030771 [Prunus dulcis]|uniref:Uncharacterized protein n=1 Tax=Prunus dulcis TaxID=3755 RepID=A0AAD4YUB6_PRUDU|nr:hypothetical protein L3X38_030771 [Prunus dulcis]
MEGEGGEGKGRGGRRRKGEEEIDDRGRVGEMEWDGGEREDEEGKRGLGSSGETKARVLESIEPLSFVDAFKNSRVRNGQQHQTQNR